MFSSFRIHSISKDIWSPQANSHFLTKFIYTSCALWTSNRKKTFRLGAFYVVQLQFQRKMENQNIFTFPHLTSHQKGYWCCRWTIIFSIRKRYGDNHRKKLRYLKHLERTADKVNKNCILYFATSCPKLEGKKRKGKDKIIKYLNDTKPELLLFFVCFI